MFKPLILYAMQILKFIHQLIAFLLELVMFGTLGYWGVKNSHSLIMKWTSGIGLPLVAIVLWAIFAAPRSALRLAHPYQIFFGWALFGLAGFMLYQTGHKTLAIVYILFAVGSGIVALFTEG